MDHREMRETLRQMLAVLQAERQALAGLDVDAIMGAAVDKQKLCGRLDTGEEHEIDVDQLRLAPGE